MKKLTLAISEEEHRKLKLIAATKGETMVGIVQKCISERYEKLEEDVEEINVKLEDSNKEIDKLKRKKNEIPSNVIIMDANDVTYNIADYLERRN